jgi:trehalose utilization protein
VLGGMGLVVLHSGHFAKIFTKLLGTTCSLKWRNDGERELVWTVKPSHPIAAGIESPIVIPRQEMYGELFDIPEPDDLIFISSFAGGEVFRSGVTFSRGKGRIFYFSPGDQEYPVYHQPQIQKVIANGVAWVAQPERFREAPEVSNPARGWFEEA